MKLASTAAEIIQPLGPAQQNDAKNPLTPAALRKWRRGHRPLSWPRPSQTVQLVLDRSGFSTQTPEALYFPATSL